MGSGMFESGVDGSGLSAYMLELYVIVQFKYSGVLSGLLI